MHKTFTFIVFLFCYIGLFSQINLTSGSPTITRDFNSLPNTGASATWADSLTLAKWYSDKSLIYITNGTTPTTISLSSYGSTGSMERALGAQGGLGTTYFAIKLRNNDPLLNITSIDVTYTGEQWREGTVAGLLAFEYQIANAGVITDANTPTTGWLANTALDFVDKVHVTAQALDGNLSTNQTNKSSNFAVVVAPGQEVWLRWKFVGGSSARCGLGIDNLTVTANYPGGCSMPTTQASNLTFTTPTPYTYYVGWTNGNGTKRMLIGKQTAPIADPAQNGDYSLIQNSTWTNYPANEMPPASSNIRVLYDDIGNNINVSALLPETQYCFSVYEYNGSHCYNLNELTGCRYTLSLEPTINSNSLTSSVVSSTQIDLSFPSMVSAGLPTTNHGYIILQKNGAIPTEIPIDGTSYTIGDNIGSATVAAIITNPATATASITSLLSNTQYCFTIYSFRWNGSNMETVNYYTPASVPNTCGLLLPVELVSFTGSCFDNNKIQLQWTTASEQNSDSFFVERSTNGINFYRIGSMVAAGNSSSTKHYTFIDNSITSNVNYYRLVEKDINNEEVISKLIETRCQPNEDIITYYNTNENSINIRFNSNSTSNLQLILSESSGRQLYKEVIETNNGFNNIVFNLKSRLAKGIYVLQINGKQLNFIEKVLIY